MVNRTSPGPEIYNEIIEETGLVFDKTNICPFLATKFSCLYWLSYEFPFSKKEARNETLLDFYVWYFPFINICRMPVFRFLKNYKR